MRQFLSPHLIRKLRLFALGDNAARDHYEVSAIHDERGYERVRASLADNLDVSANQPDIQVADVDLLGDRHLRLHHTARNGVLLSEQGLDATLRHINRLWGYRVSLASIDAQTGELISETAVGAE